MLEELVYNVRDAYLTFVNTDLILITMHPAGAWHFYVKLLSIERSAVFHI